MYQTPVRPQIAGLRELLLWELSLLYDAERQWASVLAENNESSGRTPLATGWSERARWVSADQRHLEDLFVALDAPASGRCSWGMAAILAGGRELAQGCAGSVRDAAWRGVMHQAGLYVLAGYTVTARQARALKVQPVADVLTARRGDWETRAWRW